MDFATLMETFGGWIAFMLLFLYEKIWPLLSDRLIPHRLKEKLSDREFTQQMEVRRVEASDRIAAATQTLAVSMAQTNERIATIMTTLELVLKRQDDIHAALVSTEAYTGIDRRKKE